MRLLGKQMYFNEFLYHTIVVFVANGLLHYPILFQLLIVLKFSHLGSENITKCYAVNLPMTWVNEVGRYF